MTTLRTMAIDAICQRGSIREADVVALQRAFALEPQIGASDIDALFRAHNLARVRDRRWGDFFIETLTDYVVRELEPSGYVTAAHAGWLIARVSSAGAVRSKTEHDLLLNVIDKARWVPESLMTFALGQIRDAVLTGDGPLRAGSGLGPGEITLTEVEQIRALLFAYGNEGPRSITQAEIDILLDIETAVAAREGGTAEEKEFLPLDLPALKDLAMAGASRQDWPRESWRDLLQKAVASVLLAASGYAGPTREEALSEARSLTGPGSSAWRDGSETFGGILASYRPLPSEARALLRLELQRIEIITGEAVRFADPGRLALRLSSSPLRDGAAGRTLEIVRAAGLALVSQLVSHPVRKGIQAA